MIGFLGCCFFVNSSPALIFSLAASIIHLGKFFEVNIYSISSHHFRDHFRYATSKHFPPLINSKLSMWANFKWGEMLFHCLWQKINKKSSGI